MFASGQLTRCQRRKAALLQQSTALRHTLTTEAQRLRPVMGWVELGMDLTRKARTGWATLAPLLSLWRTQKQESSGLVHKLAGAISLARSLAALWKGWR